jgi:hypothetical protein
MANHLITPSAGGYRSRRSGGFDSDHMGHMGHDEDVSVKTDKSWRYKSRVHVQPQSRCAG